jgi:hypothetical protein
MNGFGFADRLAGAAIRTVVADVERSVIFLSDGLDWTLLHADAIFHALSLIDLVHNASFQKIFDFSIPVNSRRPDGNAVWCLTLDKLFKPRPVLYGESGTFDDH